MRVYKLVMDGLYANMITFGKYNGHTYQYVLDNDRTYCNWVLKQTTFNGRMIHFQRWLQAKTQRLAPDPVADALSAHALWKYMGVLDADGSFREY